MSPVLTLDEGLTNRLVRWHPAAANIKVGMESSQGHSYKLPHHGKQNCPYCGDDTEEGRRTRHWERHVNTYSCPHDGCGTNRNTRGGIHRHQRYTGHQGPVTVHVGVPRPLVGGLPLICSPRVELERLDDLPPKDPEQPEFQEAFAPQEQSPEPGSPEAAALVEPDRPIVDMELQEWLAMMDEERPMDVGPGVDFRGAFAPAEPLMPEPLMPEPLMPEPLMPEPLIPEDLLQLEPWDLLPALYNNMDFLELMPAEVEIGEMDYLDQEFAGAEEDIWDIMLNM